MKLEQSACALVEETPSLFNEHALAESWLAINSLELESRLNFFEEVRRLEMRLIRSALDAAGNNQVRGAQLLVLGATTVNYKIKAYDLLRLSDRA